MKTHTLPSRCHEFYFAHLDTLVQVEQAEDIVTIRATRDTFSTRHKEYFIHELAAEGFIADDYRWFSLAEPYPGRTVRWLVDFSWLKISPEVTATSRRFMLRLLGTAALLWLGLMAGLFLRPAG